MKNDITLWNYDFFIIMLYHLKKLRKSPLIKNMHKHMYLYF